MSSEADVKFEIGHVLFIDIVGYSKLLIHEQSERLQRLREIARATEQFRAAEAEGKLLRLPTGDGGALVFHDSPEAPVTCALEMSKALKNHPDLCVRMGIHSGPVKEVTDLNEQANIAGAGINLAQRVMDCGDAGHILVSKHVADDLEQYDQWQTYLHDLGECEVKHGVRVHVFSLYNEEVGNSELPHKFKSPLNVGVTPRRRVNRTALLLCSAAGLVIAGLLAFWLLPRSSTRRVATVADKSIAVLPLENLSDEKENAFFADGIQDELLSNLAKVQDLKV